MIEYMKITGNRHPKSFEPSDCRYDLRVIHVLTRISVAVDRDDSLMTRSFSVQRVKILRVVSQQHPLKGLGEIERLRVRYSILRELADRHHIVSVGTQQVQLRASL